MSKNNYLKAFQDFHDQEIFTMKDISDFYSKLVMESKSRGMKLESIKKNFNFPESWDNNLKNEYFRLITLTQHFDFLCNYFVPTNSTTMEANVWHTISSTAQGLVQATFFTSIDQQYLLRRFANFSLKDLDSESLALNNLIVSFQIKLLSTSSEINDVYYSEKYKGYCLCESDDSTSLSKTKNRDEIKDVVEYLISRAYRDANNPNLFEEPCLFSYSSIYICLDGTIKPIPELTGNINDV